MDVGRCFERRGRWLAIGLVAAAAAASPGRGEPEAPAELPRTPFEQLLSYDERLLAFRPASASLEDAKADILVRWHSLALVVRWEELSLDKGRLRLKGQSREGRLRAALEAGAGASGLALAQGRSQSAMLRPGPLECVVDALGARLETALAGRIEIVPDSAPLPEAPLLAPHEVAAPLQAAIEKAVYLAFRDRLVPDAQAGRSAGEMRLDFPFHSTTLNLRGAFALRFEPEAALGDAGVSGRIGRAAFQPARGEAVPLAGGAAIWRWRRGFSERAECSTYLLSPGPGAAASLDLVFKARTDLAGEGAPGAEPVLAAPGFAAAQSYLFEVARDLDLQAATTRLRFAWRGSLRARVLAVVKDAGEPLRFDAVVLGGSLDLEEALPDPRRVRQPRRIGPIGLGGLKLAIQETPGGLALTFDAASLAAALRDGLPGDGRRQDPALRPADLEARLRLWLERALALGFLDRPGPLSRIETFELVDGSGRKAGELHALVDAAKAPEQESLQDGKRRLPSKVYPVLREWKGKVQARREENPALNRLVWTGDPVRALPRQVAFSLSDGFPEGDLNKPPPLQHQVRLSASWSCRQLGGPRFQPPAPAAEAPPVEPAPAKPAPAPSEPLGPPDLLAGLSAGELRLVEDALAGLPERAPAAVAAALERYAEMESLHPGGAASAALHAEIVRRLAPALDAACLEPLRLALAPSSSLPLRVLALRLLARGGGALAIEARIDAIAGVLAAPWPAPLPAAPDLAEADRLARRFAGHCLSELRHPRSVEALLEGLKAIEALPASAAAGSVERELRLSLASDLYRLLGDGLEADSAAAFEDIWRRRRHRLPEDPLRPGAAERITIVKGWRAFGDVRSVPVVYVIDASSSMDSTIAAARLPLPPPLKGEPEAAATISKFQWARRELAQLLGGFEPGARFGIVAFHQRVAAFAAQLEPLGATSRARAIAFLERLRTQRGTHLHGALESALAMRGAGALCLLSDGFPTRGPGADAIERDVFRWNYLKGARIVAAGFSADVAAEANLASHLARQHFGWVRILDLAGAGPPPAPAPEAPAPDPFDFGDD
jgi:hypothetical protein